MLLQVRRSLSGSRGRAHLSCVHQNNKTMIRSYICIVPFKVCLLCDMLEHVFLGGRGLHHTVVVATVKAPWTFGSLLLSESAPHVTLWGKAGYEVKPPSPGELTPIDEVGVASEGIHKVVAS